MPRFEQMRDRLPTLYRPEDDDTSLLTLFLQAAANVLEQLSFEASNVLQAHWFVYADRAVYNPFFIRSHQLQHPSQPLPKPADPCVRSFPYIHDLAGLAPLLRLPAW